MVFRYFILFIIVLLSSAKPAFAGIDPGRVAAIELASDQAKKALKSQEKAQLLMTTGHAWINVNDNVKVYQKIIQKYTTSTECCKGTKSLLYITYC